MATKPSRKSKTKPAKQLVEHSVVATSRFELPKAGSAIHFIVSHDGKVLGQLEVGRGSLSWWGRGKKIGHVMSWSKFARLMEMPQGEE